MSRIRGLIDRFERATSIVAHTSKKHPNYARRLADLETARQALLDAYSVVKS